RRYTTAQFSEIVKLLRREMPDTAITTDIMVGFPGETEEEFSETYSFVEAISFSKIHVFQYSPRAGTPAASFENQVPAESKEERSHKLIALGNQLEKAFMEQFAGKRVNVLFEEEQSQRESCYIGYTDQYVRVAVQSDTNLEGKL